MNDRVYTSAYAPLDPDGPLPPGLDERLIANAYKATGVWPKRVLVELGIRKYRDTAAIYLRKALDDYHNRAWLLTSKQVKPLHLVLYRLLINQDAYGPVYRRIVKPAEIEVTDGGHSGVALDPAEFEVRVLSDQGDRSWNSESIAPQSEPEGLVLFALAYGLFQPDSAHEILKPVLAIGPAFRAYFGAALSTAPDDGKAVEISQQTQISLELTEGISSIPPSGPVGSPLEFDAVSPSERQVAPYTGPRTQRVANGINASIRSSGV